MHKYDACKSRFDEQVIDILRALVNENNISSIYSDEYLTDRFQVFRCIKYFQAVADLELPHDTLILHTCALIMYDILLFCVKLDCFSKSEYMLAKHHLKAMANPFGRSNIVKRTIRILQTIDMPNEYDILCNKLLQSYRNVSNRCTMCHEDSNSVILNFSD